MHLPHQNEQFSTETLPSPIIDNPVYNIDNMHVNKNRLGQNYATESTVFDSALRQPSIEEVMPQIGSELLSIR